MLPSLGALSRLQGEHHVLPAQEVAPSSSSSAHSSESSTNPPLTVYTVRFTTGTSRGAALSDPYSAVNVCLIGVNGRAAIQRVSPVNDPVESRAHTAEMCQVRPQDWRRRPARSPGGA